MQQPQPPTPEQLQLAADVQRIAADLTKTAAAATELRLDQAWVGSGVSLIHKGLVVLEMGLRGELTAAQEGSQQ